MRYVMFVLLCLFHFAEARHDFQLWLFGSANTRINEKTTLFLEGEVRFEDNATSLYLYYLQGRLAFALHPWLTVAPGYRQAAVRPLIDRRWIPVYDPLVDLFVHKTLFQWAWIYRWRTQYLIPQPGRAHFQWRNGLQVHIPLMGSLKLILQEEAFIRQREGFSENRAGAGLQLITNKARFTCFYLNRPMKRYNRWYWDEVLYLLGWWSF